MKKKPYLVDVNFEGEGTFLVFATDERDAKNTIDVTCEDVDMECYEKVRLVESEKNIPDYIMDKNGDINPEYVYGLENGETALEYFEDLAKKIKMRQLDEKHYHFDFWGKEEQ
ncbi:MAG: hypothetical protein WC119_00320 [Synergistaceae bacterium]